MMRTVIIIMLCCSLVVACSKSDKLKQTVLTKQNLVEVQKQVNAGKDFTKEEKQSYMLGQIKISITGGQVVGRTVGEVIEAGKKSIPRQLKK